MKKAELVFIPSPGVGHLLSTVEIAKLLISRDDRLSITVLIMKLPINLGNTQSFSGDADSRIRFVDLPHDGSTSDLLSNSPKTFFSDFIDSQKPHVKNAVTEFITRSESSHQLAGFVIDMFCTSMIDVANDFGVPSYVFFTSSAAFLGLMFHLQSLHDEYNQDITEYKDSDAEFSVPSFANSVPAKVLPSVVFDKEGGSNMVFTCHRRFRETEGIIVNTFFELESHAIISLSDENIPPVYAVGPILNGGDVHNHQSEAIITWLDDQPPSSVVFLCFGSMGSFDADQVIEIANALERTGHRFLWSLRRPPPKGKIESPSDYTNPDEVLPEGFLDRTTGIGKVIGWAPQMAVLSHPAVGGFVSHCGWNSTLESMWCGVPLATWPLYAEQQMNAFEMVKELEMAVEIKMDYRKDFKGENPVILSAEVIETGIKRLMDNGETEVRKKVKEMREKSRESIVEGGSSYTAVGRLIDDVINKYME